MMRALRDPVHGPLPGLLFLLTAVTGVIDAVSLLTLGRVFVANITGTIVTLGLFILIINGFTFWLAAKFVPGFHVNNFGAALLGAIVVSLLSFVFSFFIKTGEKLAS